MSTKVKTKTNEEKLYTENELCEILNISSWTLKTWYLWESRDIRNGLPSYLPKPIKLTNRRGKPKRWTESMVNELKDYQGSIVKGRNGVHGAYSNPVHFETKKYKKSIENTCNDK